ncbi:MAG: phospholipase D-like domain-containing protein, partial [Ktedonobacteraceae bacterium]
MLYNQPLAIRFGTELLQHINQMDNIDPFWDKLNIAVAWVRASGMKHLSACLADFLERGGQLSVIVGIDLNNTTREGLQELLELERYGRCEIFVYHNEAGSLFHPKLYLFQNEEEARLIVGSNNITESGLYVNVEAGLQVDTDVNATVITQALDALSSWKDTKSRLAVQLDGKFLARLSKEGYVPDEANKSAWWRGKRAPKSGKRSRALFGSRKFNAPRRRKTKSTAINGTHGPRPPQVGTVVLMRLRKASQTNRPTQAQIPFRVVDIFFKGATKICSAHSGAMHRLV